MKKVEKSSVMQVVSDYESSSFFWGLFEKNMCGDVDRLVEMRELRPKVEFEVFMRARHVARRKTKLQVLQTFPQLGKSSDTRIQPPRIQ
jgi:hypothetical protein